MYRRNLLTSNYFQSAIYGYNIVNGATVTICGAATANSVYDVCQEIIEKGQAPSPLTMLQLGSSLFFFGNSVYSFRTAGTIIQEVQTSTLSEISQSFKSNNQRYVINFVGVFNYLIYSCASNKLLFSNVYTISLSCIELLVQVLSVFQNWSEEIL